MTKPSENGDRLTLVDIIAARRNALTADELADYLSTSRRQVCEMARAGHIPSMHIGGLLRFDPKLTAQWLEEQATTSQAV